MPEGSKPLVGSSRITNLGLPSRAIARPSRCFIPSEKPLASVSARSIRPTSCNRLSISEAASRRPRVAAWISMFSLAVARPYSAGPSIRDPVFRVASMNPVVPGEDPSSEALPELIGVSPSRTRIAVVLPDPFGPSNPQTVPSGTSSDRSSSATVEPKRLVTASSRIRGSLIPVHTTERPRGRCPRECFRCRPCTRPQRWPPWRHA